MKVKTLHIIARVLGVTIYIDGVRHGARTPFTTVDATKLEGFY